MMNRPSSVVWICMVALLVVIHWNPQSAHGAGACCLDNDACSDTSGSTCIIGLGGVFAGEGTSCSTEGVCYGACCDCEFGCYDYSELGCYSAGSIFALFVGPRSSCASDPCTGACCQSDGSCTVGPFCSCSPLEFQGLGSSCATGVCGWACCLANGSCGQTNPSVCTNNHGDYQGDGVSCAGLDCTGACCGAGAVCTNTNEVACAGEFRGYGTRCDTEVCGGACCFANGTCDLDIQSSCRSRGGVSRANWSDCTVCPRPLTAFTYHGQLKSGGVPVNGPVDFQFTLWDDEADGHQRGASLPRGDVDVRNGLFTLELDFGPGAFDWTTQWLQIEVCQGTWAQQTDFTTLTPRQHLTAVPFALQLVGVAPDEYEAPDAPGTAHPDPEIAELMHRVSRMEALLERYAKERE